MSGTFSPDDSLRARLRYEPQPLKFGTSGRRGKVVDLTQLEIYTNVVAEIDYLLSLEPSQGGIRAGDEFYFAYDLRPSSTEFVENRRGGICQAVEQALRDKGMRPVNLGAIPTPALTYHALRHDKGSIMVTGSHIPFDRNGYKLNTSKGELLKKDEQPINANVERMRAKLLNEPYSESLFDDWGNLRNGKSDLPAILANGQDGYVKRYLDFFGGETLNGMKLLVYQHSAVGRDILVDILQKLGAQVTPAGRSSTFVPIDTEAIDVAQLGTIQKLFDEAGATFDAVVSTDGDSDRPLLVAPEGNKLRFFGGDLLGMIVAEYLGADAVVVPISTNDAIDRGSLAPVLEAKTKIGSPYVIAGMQTAVAKGHRRVCGWEANGGFLTGSDIDRNGKTLTALPTRDAVLPLLCALSAANQRRMTVPELFSTLPRRFSRASLLRNFPRSASLKIIARFSPPDASVQEVSYHPDHVVTVQTPSQASTSTSTSTQPSKAHAEQLEQIRKELQTIFSAEAGFAPIARLNYTDGMRIIFTDGCVAHVRPSGNADELRIYSVADTQAHADEIVARGVEEPNGLLRQLERLV
jgi:phosphomannomutase